MGEAKRGKTVRDQSLRGRGLTKEPMFSSPVEFESYLAGNREPLKEATEQRSNSSVINVYQCLEWLNELARTSGNTKFY